MAANATALLLGHGGPELGVDDGAPHQVGEVEAGQQEARTERGGVEVGHRHAEHRPHDDQHHRGRDQDAERAAGGDGAGREPVVVARLDHDRRGHDAEHRHRRADDAGGHGEHRGGEHDHQVEGAADGGQQQAEGREQALHEAGLLGDETHEDEERHRGEQLLLHEPDGLEVGEVEDRGAEREVAEGEGEKQQREGDRHADEDRSQQHQEHDQSNESFPAHTSTFSLCSSSTPVRAM
jgi:hypothetical protein